MFRQLERQVGLKWSWHGSHKVITLGNGGQIQLAGMSTKAEVQKLRGEGILSFYFDECGVPPSDLLKEAVISCAWPATLQHRGKPGSGVVLAGTPGPLPEGFFWECSAKGMYGASNHTGTLYDNPLFQVIQPDGRTLAEKVIQEDLDANLYISREDSRFRREILAHWCLPSELRCYSNFSGLVLPQTSVPWQGRTILAVDFGWHDHTAIVILRLTDFEELHPQGDGSTRKVTGQRVHVLHARKRAHWQLPDLADKIRELTSIYGVGTIVGDSGGNLQSIESFASMFGISMLPAQKGGLGLKRSRIHTINDLFAVGHIFLYEEAACLADELGWLVWNEDRDDHDERQEDHAADAFGYGFIETYVPITVERLASQLERDAEAREARKRHALNRGRK